MHGAAPLVLSCIENPAATSVPRQLYAVDLNYGRYLRVHLDTLIFALVHKNTNVSRIQSKFNPNITQNNAGKTILIYTLLLWGFLIYSFPCLSFFVHGKSIVSIHFHSFKAEYIQSFQLFFV